MIKAIIFDMDGLLIDSEPVWFRARKELLGNLNLEWTWDLQRKTLGVSTKDWVEQLYNIVSGAMTRNELQKGVTDRMLKYYANGEVDVMPGADAALKYAKDNFKVGLASGSYKELLYSAVKVKNWASIFDEILSSDDMERGKPHPDVYLETAKRLGVLPEECVVLEDSANGIKAGVAAGTKVITVPSKDIQVPQEVLDTAYAVIDSLNEFPNIVIDMGN